MMVVVVTAAAAAAAAATCEQRPLMVGSRAEENISLIALSKCRSMTLALLSRLAMSTAWRNTCSL